MTTLDTLLGQTLDEYRLVAELGRGGMARVYRGYDQRLRRFAAIKVIDTRFRADPEYVARFEREARTIAQLDHPHIVRLYRYGNVDGLLYMAMQFVPGAALDVVLESYRADRAIIEPAGALRLVGEVCLALDYAHSQGVIHRDVKPSNILLDQHGRAILTDFGLALLADVGTRGRTLGSPHYVAPEQALSSAQAVPQSDLYSVGVILYEMFTGEVPFQAAEPMDVALMQVQAAPRPPRALRPELSPALESVILKCLAKAPAQRYASGAALAAALEHALGPALAQPATVPHRSLPDRVAQHLSRHGPLLAAAAAAPAPPAAPPLSTAPQPPAPFVGPRPTSRRSSRPLSAGLGVVVTLAVVIGCGLLAVWAGGRAAGLLAPVLSATPALATDRPAPLPTALPTLTSAPPATPTPPPPAGPELLLVKSSNNNHLVVINRGAAPLPLAPLTLGEGPGAVDGAAWELRELPSGACVAVWREDKRKTLPEGIECRLMGAELERDGRERFWRERFVVYYGGERLGVCDNAEQLCPLP